MFTFGLSLFVGTFLVSLFLCKQFFYKQTASVYRGGGGRGEREGNIIIIYYIITEDGSWGGGGGFLAQTPKPKKIF